MFFILNHCNFLIRISKSTVSNAFLRSSITAPTSSPESNPLMIYSLTSMSQSAVSVENLLLKPDWYSFVKCWKSSRDTSPSPRFILSR